MEHILKSEEFDLGANKISITDNFYTKVIQNLIKNSLIHNEDIIKETLAQFKNENIINLKVDDFDDDGSYLPEGPPDVFRMKLNATLLDKR